MLEITGAPLTIDQLAGLPSDGSLQIALGADVRAAVEAASAAAAAYAAADGRAYGRTTGVGANRTVGVAVDDDEHGLRLIRSHTYDAGEPLDDRVVRAAMVVRANQLARSRSGLRPEVLDALIAACNDGRTPVVGRLSSMGVGDVAMFAAVGLGLIGERPWSDGARYPYLDTIRAEDALALMSTNAALIALAALAAERAARWLQTAHVVTALTHVAIRGNAEAYAEAVHLERAHPGAVRSAGIMRRLLDGAGAAARVQDPLSLRCSPQVHGAALGALDDLQRDVHIELGSSSENPLYVDGVPFHHGGFHNAVLALGTDRLRLALLQAADMSVARLTKLHEPPLTGQRAFLADGPPTASGTMMVEYTAIAALAEVRSAAHPACGASATYSRGVEDVASFAWQSAWEVGRLLDAADTVLACELLAAIRSLGLPGAARAMPAALAQAAAAALALPVVAADHELTSHLAAATALIAAGLGRG